MTSDLPSEVSSTAIGIVDAATNLVPGVLQCRRCTNCWPKSEFQLNDKKPNYGLCRYCIAQQRMKIIDDLIARRAEEVAQTLLAEKGVTAAGVAKVEEFIGSLDLTMGGIHQVANRMARIVDGLIEKGAFATAGQLLLQLQKLRLSVQKQNHDEDYSQLSLKQKQDKLHVELLRLAAEHRMRVDQEKFTRTVEAAMGAEVEMINEIEAELSNER